MHSAPQPGIVTFLFTDLEGSTRLWETHPRAMQATLACHDQILKETVVEYGGDLVKSTGDGIHAVFSSPTNAASAALAAQVALLAESWEDTSPLRVRMGLHSGEAQYRDGDYFGGTVNRAARIMSIAYGGQILLSHVTAVLVEEALPANVSLVDLGQHRLRSLSSPEQIYQLNKPPLPEVFPPLKSQNIIPNNLPSQITSFVGREKEIAALQEMVGDSRLVTLVGVGGTGKTRLMLQVAEYALPQFPDGVWLVELASLSDPKQIPPRLAKVFSIQESHNNPLEEALVDYLRYKHALLLLDNCEHLIDACAQLAQTLLQACPQLRILATSREGLAIPGEVTYQVPSLSLPAKKSASPEYFSSSEAVDLFSERAKAANPAFELTQDNAPIIAEICRRLDGIPLAIELAASRSAVLSVAQIAERLQDRFRLLSGGSRTALPRQQTLQALIDWSWNLLSEGEQHLLRGLSVFAGGWSLSAAEAIAATDDSIDVFDTLTHLVRKSLVVVENMQTTTVRYNLLESIRLYAFDRLLEAGEVATMRDRHAEYYINLVLQAEEFMSGPDMHPWITSLRQEIDNLRGAIEWSLDSQPELALRFAGVYPVLRVAIFSAQEGRSWVAEAIRKAEAALPDLDEDEYKGLLARAYITLSGISLSTGDNHNAFVYAQTAVSFARQLGDTLLLAVGLRFVSLGSVFSGDLETAVLTMTESLVLSREHGYTYEMAMVYVSILGISLYKDRFGEPQSYIGEYEQVVRTLQNPWITASYTSFAGSMAANNGDLEESRAQFERSVDLFLQLGDWHFAISARSDLGHILREHSRIEEAEAIYTETITEWFQLGHRPAVAHQLECFAFIAIAQEEPKRAARLLGASQAIRSAANASRNILEEEQFQDAVEYLRRDLAEDVFERALRSGEILPIEKAIAYALRQDADPPT